MNHYAPFDPAMEALDEALLARVVERFYATVRRDPLLGPIFEDAIADWDAHLVKLTAFWAGVMLGKRGFEGHPMAAHVRHEARISDATFARWLTLWREVTDAECPPAVAAALQAKADRIGESQQMGLFFFREKRAGRDPFSARHAAREAQRP